MALPSKPALASLLPCRLNLRSPPHVGAARSGPASPLISVTAHPGALRHGGRRVWRARVGRDRRRRRMLLLLPIPCHLHTNTTEALREIAPRSRRDRAEIAPRSRQDRAKVPAQEEKRGGLAQAQARARPVARRRVRRRGRRRRRQQQRGRDALDGVHGRGRPAHLLCERRRADDVGAAGRRADRPITERDRAGHDAQRHCVRVA